MEWLDTIQGPVDYILNDFNVPKVKVIRGQKVTLVFANNTPVKIVVDRSDKTNM